MKIGLCGYPRSGKSEVSRILTDYYGFQILDTKKVLRDISSLITGIPSDDFKLGKIKDNREYFGVSLRKIMGKIGDSLEEMFGEEYLLKRALEEPWIYPEKKLVVDSLRQNQALFFDGIVVEVWNPRFSTAIHSFDSYDRSRVSYTLDNSGDVYNLEKNVNEMMFKLDRGEAFY